MTNNAIRTYDDLLQEEERLRRRLAVQQAEIRLKLQHVKESLLPATRFLSFMGNITNPRNHSLLKTGLRIGVDFLLKKSLFRKTNWLVSLAGSSLIRNVASGFLAGKVAGLLNKAGRLVGEKKVTRE